MKKLGGIAEGRVAAWLEEKWGRFRDARDCQEQIWYRAHQNTMARYDRGAQGAFRAEAEAERSDIFVRLTRAKVRTAIAGGRRALVLNDVPFDLVLYEGTRPEDWGLTEEEVRARLDRAREEIKEALALQRASEKLGDCLHDAAEYGTAVVRTDQVGTRQKKAWGLVEGRFARVDVGIEYPAFDVVSPWWVYPDPAALDDETQDGVIQYHHLRPEQLRRMAERCGWDRRVVGEVLKDKPSDAEEDWQTQMRQADEKDDQAPDGHVAVKEFFGVVPKEVAEEWGSEVLGNLDEDDPDTHVAAAWCNGRVLKCVKNPAKRHPYLFFQWERQPHSLWGVGVAENGFDSQDMVNGAVRLFVANKSYAANGMIEMDVGKLEAGQELTSLYAGKVWLRKAGAAPGPAVTPVAFPDVTYGLMDMIGLFERYFDEATGIAKYTSGDEAPHLNKTATGISLLMGAQGKQLADTMARFDDEVIEPVVERMLEWFWEQSDMAVVPLTVRATGIGTATEADARLQKTIGFLGVMAQVLGVPEVAQQVIPQIEWKELFEQIVRDFGLVEVMKDKEETQVDPATIEQALSLIASGGGAGGYGQPGVSGLPGTPGGEAGGAPGMPGVVAPGGLEGVAGAGPAFGGAGGYPGEPSDFARA